MGFWRACFSRGPAGPERAGDPPKQVRGRGGVRVLGECVFLSRSRRPREGRGPSQTSPGEGRLRALTCFGRFPGPRKETGPVRVPSGGSSSEAVFDAPGPQLDRGLGRASSGPLQAPRNPTAAQAPRIAGQPEPPPLRWVWGEGSLPARGPREPERPRMTQGGLGRLPPPPGGLRGGAPPRMKRGWSRGGGSPPEGPTQASV